MVKIIQYFLIILIAPLIILGNFNYLIFNFSFYQKVYRETGVYQDFSDVNKVDSATKNLVGFFKGRNKLDDQFYSQQAKLHLSDVKRSINLESNYFFLLTIASIVSAVTLIYKHQFKKLLQSVLISSISTFVTILFLSIGLLNFFDKFFEKFHKVIFNNDLWIFPADDNLIRLFPQQFFISFADSLAKNILITSFLLALITLILNKRVFK